MTFEFPGQLSDGLSNFPRPVSDALFLPRTCFSARSAEYTVFARFWEHLRGELFSFADELFSFVDKLFSSWGPSSDELSTVCDCFPAKFPSRGPSFQLVRQNPLYLEGSGSICGANCAVLLTNFSVSLTYFSVPGDHLPIDLQPSAIVFRRSSPPADLLFSWFDRIHCSCKLLGACAGRTVQFC